MLPTDIKRREQTKIRHDLGFSDIHSLPPQQSLQLIYLLRYNTITAVTAAIEGLALKTQHSDLPFRLGKPKWGEEILVYSANEGFQPALCWLERLVQTGPSAKFLKDLNTRLRAVPETIQAYPEIEPTTLKVSSSYEAKGDARLDQQWSEAELDWLWAYLLATALEKGSLKHLKRCNLRDCSKYFIGDPRSKWCSKTCGSLYRVTKQRNQDNPAKWKSMVWEY